MPESGPDQLNAVLSSFGFVVHRSQQFEQKLRQFLATYNEVTSDSVTVEGLGSERSIERSLTRIKQHVTIAHPSEDWKLFRTSLREQRFLLHSFLIEREAELRTDEGRQDLIVELLRVAHNFHRSQVVLTSMRTALSQSLSI